MKKILIVEDDQLVATAYRKRFKDAGWDAEWAPDGIEGIKAVGTIKPDVVLLDLLMPRLDGIEVLKYIRAHPDLRNLPVVVFSNSYMTNLIENAWRAGADQCLMKASTTPQSLFDAIGKAMQKAAARAAEGVGIAPGAVPPIPGPRAQISSAPLVAPLGTVISVEPKRPYLPPGVRPSSVPPVQPLAYPVAPLVPPPTSQPSPAPPPPAVAAAGGPASASGQESGTGTTPPVPMVDPEFQAQIRQLFVAGAGAKLEAVHTTAQALARESGAAVTDRIMDLFRTVHSLTGNAAVAGCPAIAHYASTFEAFLQELQQKQRFINASTIRTIHKGIDFVSLLFQYALVEPPPDLARRVLVVDGDPMSGQAISLTLEKAGLRTHLAGDPIEAMALGSSEMFDLVVTAAELPGMSGFEVCAQLETLPGCANVPVLLVTSNEQFESHAHPEVLGDNDVIARPFLIIELTLKVHTLIESHRFKTHFASAA
jgi:CheY-like chemotaxis protein